MQFLLQLIKSRRAFNITCQILVEHMKECFICRGNFSIELTRIRNSATISSYIWGQEENCGNIYAWHALLV